MAHERQQMEEGYEFLPKFDAQGLIPVIAQDFETGQILMVAYMNQESLELTIRSGHAVYYSRSRQKLWKKGEQSGHMQKVREVLVDCDQDCLVLKVSVDSGQCHNGFQSCFYRSVELKEPEKLSFIAKKVFDPKLTYGT